MACHPSFRGAIPRNLAERDAVGKFKASQEQHPASGHRVGEKRSTGQE